jgi:hypothetical protein
MLGLGANRNSPICAKNNGPTGCEEVDGKSLVVMKHKRLPAAYAEQPPCDGAELYQVAASLPAGGSLGVRSEEPLMRMVMQWCWSRSSKASTRDLLPNSSYHCS